MKRRTFLAAELSWTEFEEHMRRDDVIIIPVGMLEEHGRHNPLGTDTFIAGHCAALIGERAGALVAPVFPYGYGPEGKKYPGQVSLSPRLLRKIWYAYGASYAKHGARRFLFINGHGGNAGILRMVAGDLWRDYHALCASTEWWLLVPQIKPELPCNDHGGLYETSCMLAIKPDLVDMTRAKDPVPDTMLSEHIRAGYTITYKGEPFFATSDDYRLGRAGNLGAPPQGANEKTGADVLEAYIDYNAGLIGELRKIDLKHKETH
ncbi:MAG: creatininase family protein [Spirochaetaceae bacterium]|jgi:creatinine amidohydrolase|nr:creatininase family protein [Spirochaetaceae bacterium]